MEAVHDFWKSFVVNTNTFLFGIVVPLVVISAIKLGGVSATLSDLSVFLSGGVREITKMQLNDAAIPILFTVLALNFIAGCATIVIAITCIGKPEGEHAISTELREDGWLKLIFSVVLWSNAEEIIFRWLPFGLLTKISFLSGTVTFYCLLLVANALFALMHLLNFKERDRNVFMVLPQFMAGILYTYVFVKFGLMACIILHCLWNIIIVSLLITAKRER